MSTRRERRTARALSLDAFRQDVRFALRGFGRQRGWTAVAIITLALGIGATTAVFAVVNSLILHPLAYPGLDRVVSVWLEPTANSMQKGVTVTVTPDADAVRTWVGNARSFEALEPYAESDVTVERRDAAPATLHGAYIQSSFPRFAGARVLLGRMFTAQDVASRQDVLLLSEGAWRAKFGSDPGVIGRTLTVNDKLFTIIGVLPGSLAIPRLGTAPSDLWMPLHIERGPGYNVVGRLRPGVSAAAATAELDRLYATSPALGKGPAPFHARLMLPREMVSFRQSLYLLSGAVALVLLIACTNVAHLLLARAAGRQRELAIRQALGAGRARLLAQMLTETVVLALSGSVAGTFLGWIAVRTLVRLRPENLASLGAARLDPVVLLGVVALALLTGVAFGVFTTVQSWRHSTHESLKTGALTTSQTRSHNRVRSLLVVTEMALSATLLVGASLLVRSVVKLQTTQPGFEPAGLYALDPGLPRSRYPDSTSRKAFFADLVTRVRAVPGVQDVSLAANAPPGYNFTIGALQVEGEPEPPPHATSFIRYQAVTPNYFRTMRLPIAEGRAYEDSTEAGVVMINEGFAKAHWPGASPLGKRMKLIDFSGHGTWLTVIGVVADAATGGLTDERSSPMLYTQLAQESPTIIVRVTPGMDVMAALRAIVATLDPRLPPPRLFSVEAAMNSTAAEPRFTMMLLLVFTVLAVVLAAVGLYGVMSYAVAQRTREIGIRIALGATRGDVSRDVVRNGVALAAAGAVLGLLGAWWATKIVEKMLYGVSRTDPLSFTMGALVLLLTAIVACVVPMRRAASVDPLIAMKAD